jgi:hypothetical protein
METHFLNSGYYPCIKGCGGMDGDKMQRYFGDACKLLDTNFDRKP